MTRIAKVSVDWMEGWANDPTFRVTLCDTPEKVQFWPAEDEASWIKHPSGIHFAPCIVLGAPQVAYFYTDGKPTQGYGGRRFAGTFLDGSRFEYRGAWSSRAACVNRAFPDSRIVDVSIGNCATAVLASQLIQWFKEHREELDFGLAWVDTGDDAPILLPTRDSETKNRDQRILKHI